MKKNSRKKNKKLILFSKIIFILLIVVSLVLFEIVLTMQVFPLKYVLPVLVIYILMLFGIGHGILKKRKKAFGLIMLDFFTLILIAALSFGLYYLNSTIHFMDKIKASKYQIEEYYVIVDKDSDYSKLDDLNNQELGVYESTLANYNKALEEVKGKIEIDEKDYDDYLKLSNDLLNDKVDSILISSAYKDMVEDDLENFDDETRIIYTVKIKVENNTEVKNVDVTNKSFNIYISGIDIYGDISSVSRSDVNMIVTVNPNTHKVLLTSIPRDYYVQLNGTTGNRDKLTHAGIYGINSSVKTIEDLLEIDVNYYVRVNFTTVVKLVDAIGGISIYSDASFTSTATSSCSFKKGTNNLDGKCALAFARERYTYATGDRHRVENQQNVLTAILNKTLSSKTLITKYTTILQTMGSSFQTNMPTSSIYDLVNKQLDSMPEWSIETYSLDGSDKMAYTYSYPKQLLYVMEPDMNTVNEAREKIDNIENGD